MSFIKKKLYIEKYVNNKYYLSFIKNTLKIKDIIDKHKVIKIFKNDNRSLVKLINYKGQKIIIKKYKTIRNSIRAYYEFLNMMHISYYNIINVPIPIGFYYIKNKFNIVSESVIIYYYLENNPCHNFNEKLVELFLTIHSKNYIYTDIKKEHFIYNDKKLYIIDIDHHLKINKYGDIKKKLNLVDLTINIPETKKFLNLDKIYYIIYYIYKNFLYIGFLIILYLYKYI